MLETAVVDAPTPEQITDANEAWIEALPARVYHTPQYGQIPIEVDKLQRFITNFRQNVRGQEIATDYEHGLDTAKGLQASGWYRDFDIRPSSDDPNQMSLYAKVQFTDDAKKDIRDGKYKYWSLEWDDEYVTDGGQLVPDVVLGGGLTNRPVAKRTMPINFSEHLWNELDEDTKRQFAVWSTKYVNDLPDSAFLYKDSNGRHLPYKDKDGKIDIPHLRNAAARVNQIKGVSESTVNALKAKINRLLQGANKASELAKSDDEYITLCTGILLSEAAMEHSDPGINAPLYGAADQPDPGFGQPVARVTGDPAKDDPAIGGMWRRDPLPQIEKGREDDPIDQQESREGGNTMEFTEKNVSDLRELLGITDKDANGDVVVETTRNAFSELKQFKDSVGAATKEKRFAEEYPEMYRQHQELLASQRSSNAKAFSESVSRINKVTGKNDDDTPKLEPTRNGLSALALETIAEVHKKFSEGTATVDDFENAVKTIANGGVVEFGEVGSSRMDEHELPSFDVSTAQGRANARKVFAEKVSEVQAKHAKENDGATLPIVEATAKASQLYPELAEAYLATG